VDKVLDDVRAEWARADGIHGDGLAMPLIIKGDWVDVHDEYGIRTEARSKMVYKRAAIGGNVTHMHVISEEISKVTEALFKGDIDHAYTEAIQSAAMFAKLARAIDHKRKTR